MACKPGPCSIDGCDLQVFGRGWCCKHWTSWRRYGDPLHCDKNKKTASKLYWMCVEVGEPDECWTWTGLIDRDGYGTFAHRENGFRRAHRISYEEQHGPIPDGLVADHQCHNWDDNCAGGASCLHRRCVNPAHILLVDGGTNVLRSMKSVASLKSAQTHCIHGHPLSGDNLYIGPDGHRVCRTCRRDNKRRRRQELRAQGKKAA